MRAPARWLWRIAALLALGGAALYHLGSGVRVERGSVLVFDLGGSYPEGPRPALSRWLSGDPSGPVTLSGVLSELSKAERDERLSGVAFRIRDLEIGWGKAQELRNAILALRASGRRTSAYLEVEGFDAGLEYYVASAADSVHVPQGAHTPFVGLVSAHFFLGGLWDKLGVGISMERIGPYKSAGEQLSASSMSAAYREMARSLLQSLWDQFETGVRDTRPLAPQAMREMLQDPVVPLATLRRRGILDAAKSFPQVVADLGGGPDTRWIGSPRYARVDPTDAGIRPRAKIAVVYATGPVVLGNPSGWSATALLAADPLMDALQRASTHPEVSAIVLRIDSPGGSALASELIWQAVRDAGLRRPVIASLSDVAASGGYYIASAAHHIVADPATLTGSIGVVALHPSFGDALAQLGVATETLALGAHAGLLQTMDPLSPPTQKLLERSIAEIYDLFVERVAVGRNLSRERVDALGRGRVWTGLQAREHGLVDSLGGLREALREAKRAAGLDPDADVTLIGYPEAHGWLDELLSLPTRSAARTEQDRWLSALSSLPLPPRVRDVLVWMRFPLGTPLLLSPILPVQ